MPASSPVLVTHALKIPTKDDTGKPNGYVVPIWNANERPDLRPDQVYLTAVAPHSQKGPHLHKVRRGMFCCIKGNVRIVTRSESSGAEHRFEGLLSGIADRPCTRCGAPDRDPIHRRGVRVYSSLMTGEAHDHALICVPPGVAACIYNDSDEEALVLNMPSPAWRADAQDEWPVEDWKVAA